MTTQTAAKNGILKIFQEQRKTRPNCILLVGLQQAICCANYHRRELCFIQGWASWTTELQRDSLGMELFITKYTFYLSYIFPQKYSQSEKWTRNSLYAIHFSHSLRIKKLE